MLSGLNRSGASEVQDSLIARLRELPGVVSLARSSEVPTSSRENNTAFTVQGREQEVGNQILNYISADYDYFDIYGIEPLVGRVFSEEFGMDLLTANPVENNIRVPWCSMKALPAGLVLLTRQLQWAR